MEKVRSDPWRLKFIKGQMIFLFQKVILVKVSLKFLSMSDALPVSERLIDSESKKRKGDSENKNRYDQ